MYLCTVFTQKSSFPPDWVDSSGIVLHITDRKRKYDAAIMELGLEYTDKMAIPGGQRAFPLSGHCIPQCTGVVCAAAYTGRWQNSDGLVLFINKQALTVYLGILHQYEPEDAAIRKLYVNLSHTNK